MGLFILLALIAMPIIEIAVFIDVGEKIGLANTLVVVFLTAIAGAGLLRWQGLSVLGRAQAALHEGRFPLDEIFDGLCLVFAGALLLTPGFVTDTIGFLLFLPPIRLVLKSVAGRAIAQKAQFHHVHMETGDDARRQNSDDGVIDGDFEDITSNKAEPTTTERLPPNR